MTSQVTKQASYSVTSNVTISTPAVDELACFLCGKRPGAVEYMFVRGELALCSECGEGKGAYPDVEEAFENIALAMIDLFEKRMEPVKIDVERLLEELEASLREGLVPEAEQAYAARCQQHLRAMIVECDAMLREVGIAG